MQIPVVSDVTVTVSPEDEFALIATSGSPTAIEVSRVNVIVLVA